MQRGYALEKTIFERMGHQYGQFQRPENVVSKLTTLHVTAIVQSRVFASFLAFLAHHRNLLKFYGASHVNILLYFWRYASNVKDALVAYTKTVVIRVTVLIIFFMR